MSPNEPLDPVHAESMRLVAAIRDAVAQARARVAKWEPSRMPDGYGIVKEETNAERYARWAKR